MNIWDTILMALRAISRNKVRSVLTALGIVIGVASVIAMVHLGQSATRSVTSQISSMGSNLLIIRPGRSRGPGGVRGSSESFEVKDSEAIARQVNGVLVAPAASSRQTLVYGNANITASVTGSNNNFFQVRNWTLKEGRLFEEAEVKSGAAVCVVGKTIVDDVYSGQDPIGTALRVGTSACQVVGVLEGKGEGMGSDQDEIVVMPLKAVQRRLAGNFDVQNIYVSALQDGTTSQVKTEVENVLRERRNIRSGAEDDFDVRDMQEIAQTLEKTTSTLTFLLGAIAAVSLLVGGIGIMNIMLVSVTERTREIGIRLAIGALARDVMTQFLVESIVLSSLGGAIGLALGIGATWLMTSQMGTELVLDVPTLALAFGFSAIIGVVFGYVPARKAAHLNPIESLRHE